ncbi:2-amino-4-hydroxy-6-hydroxymethyldihydropteridine diphosphokinase [Castellaniella hirudinis]|uniref:2-amino-4-hydroxy-6- hydroxymethyldihydropteridine diphosphokinase n=1 Tax=Castellaniella hirudinis TaxID=1144617 RepID=UPI0039C45EEB
MTPGNSPAAADALPASAQLLESAAPSLAFIGLGANLGDAHATLKAAGQALAAVPGVVALRLSPFYGTAPVGCAGPDYVNAVAEIQTRLTASALLGALQAIEQAHGRLRPYRNAPRTLDLDLLWYAGLFIDLPQLTVPHPRMHERAFVLRPLMDLAPGLVLPQGDLPTLLAACAGQAIRPCP